MPLAASYNKYPPLAIPQAEQSSLDFSLLSRTENAEHTALIWITNLKIHGAFNHLLLLTFS